MSGWSGGRGDVGDVESGVAVFMRLSSAERRVSRVAAGGGSEQAGSYGFMAT